MTKTTIVLAALGFVLLAGVSAPAFAAEPRYPAPGMSGPDGPGPYGPGEMNRRPGAGQTAPGGAGSGARPGCLLWTGNDLTCNHYYDQCSGASWKNCGGVWTQK